MKTGVSLEDGVRLFIVVGVPYCNDINRIIGSIHPVESDMSAIEDYIERCSTARNGELDFEVVFLQSCLHSVIHLCINDTRYR